MEKGRVKEGLVLVVLKLNVCGSLLQVARRRVRICRNVVFTSIEASRDPLLWEDALWETTINVIPPEEAATFVESLCNLD